MKTVLRLESIVLILKKIIMEKILAAKCRGITSLMRNFLLAVLISLVLLFGLIGSVDSVLALSEQELTNGFGDRLQEFMDNQGKKSTFTIDGGVVIHYEHFDQPCIGKAIIILPGWSEPYLKYAEVIYDLRNKHYCVYAADYRGAGIVFQTG